LSNNLDKGLKRKKSIDQNEEASKKLKGDKLSRRDSEKDKGNSFVTRPTLRYADLGGIESILQVFFLKLFFFFKKKMKYISNNFSSP